MIRRTDMASGKNTPNEHKGQKDMYPITQGSRHHQLRFAIFLIATCTILTRADAQNVFKCGDSYSQTPCPGAALIDANDNRTGTQKAQADTATVRTAKLADQMEKDRLAQEARDLAAGTPRNASKKAKSTKATVTGTTASEAAPNKTKAKKKKKKTGPEYFTAQSPKEAAKEAPGKSVNQ
ncbi:MAG: hypothetical protein RIS34_2271 [Pseudomonadota bacterium]